MISYPFPVLHSFNVIPVADVRNSYVTADNSDIATGAKMKQWLSEKIRIFDEDFFLSDFDLLKFAL